MRGHPKWKLIGNRIHAWTAQIFWESSPNFDYSTYSQKQRPDHYTYQVSVYLPSISILIIILSIFIFKYWYWYFLFQKRTEILILQFFWNTDTDTYSVFFRLNTDTDTSAFESHTGYWILVFSFRTGQVSGSKPYQGS